MTIGQNIKRIRTEQGLTQEQLGNMCGIKGESIRRYELEKVNPKMPNLRKISKALNVSVSEIDESISCVSTNTIGTRIRKQRIIHGVTQKELAQRTGLSVGTIQQLEYEQYLTRMETVKKIAHALNISVSDIESDFCEKIYIEKPLSSYTMEELLSEVGRRLDNGTRKEL